MPYQKNHKKTDKAIRIRASTRDALENELNILGKRLGVTEYYSWDEIIRIITESIRYDIPVSKHLYSRLSN